MDVAGTIAYLPLTAMVLGAIAGLVAGRFLTGRWLWVLPVGLFAVVLVLIVRLAMIPEGQEETAFGPFVWLTGRSFPRCSPSSWARWEGAPCATVPGANDNRPVGDRRPWAHDPGTAAGRTDLAAGRRAC